MTRQAIGWKKIFAKDIYDKGLKVHCNKYNKCAMLVQGGKGTGLYGDFILSIQFFVNLKLKKLSVFLKMIKPMHHARWYERRVVRSVEAQRRRACSA